ncbi:MAG: alpha/beta hydrolase [Chloroflexota bacterium]
MFNRRFLLCILFLFSLVLVACDPQALTNINSAAIETRTEHYQREVTIVEPPMEFQIDDLTLVYETRGEGQPVLMLHGWPTDRHSMIGAMEPIFRQREGWQRVYVDLPGMGETNGGSWINGNDDVLQVLIQFMDERYPAEPFLVAGFSYGGYLARGMLHEKHDQIDGMLLFAPVIPGNREARILAPHRVIVSNPEGLKQFPEPIAEFLAAGLVVQDDAVLARQPEILGGLERADQAALARISQNYAFSFEVDDLPEPYEAPVLILTGKHDSVVGYENVFPLLSRYPRATFAVLDRAGHALHTEQVHLFNTLVDEWLDRVQEAQIPSSQ